MKFFHLVACLAMIKTAAAVCLDNFDVENATSRRGAMFNIKVGPNLEPHQRVILHGVRVQFNVRHHSGQAPVDAKIYLAKNGSRYNDAVKEEDKWFLAATSSGLLTTTDERTDLGVDLNFMLERGDSQGFYIDSNGPHVRFHDDDNNGSEETGIFADDGLGILSFEGAAGIKGRFGEVRATGQVAISICYEVVPPCAVREDQFRISGLEAPENYDAARNTRITITSCGPGRALDGQFSATPYTCYGNASDLEFVTQEGAKCSPWCSSNVTDELFKANGLVKPDDFLANSTTVKIASCLDRHVHTGDFSSQAHKCTGNDEDDLEFVKDEGAKCAPMCYEPISKQSYLHFPTELLKKPANFNENSTEIPASSCVEGYSAKSDLDKITCRGNVADLEQLLKEADKCEPIPCNLNDDDFNKRHYKFTVKNIQGYTDLRSAGEVEVQCANDYVAVGNKSFANIVCQDKDAKKKLDTFPKCERLCIGINASMVANKSYNAVSGEFAGDLTFTCKTNFEFEDAKVTSANMTCKGGANDADVKAFNALLKCKVSNAPALSAATAIILAISATLF